MSPKSWSDYDAIYRNSDPTSVVTVLPETKGWDDYDAVYGTPSVDTELDTLSTPSRPLDLGLGRLPATVAPESTLAPSPAPMPVAPPVAPEPSYGDLMRQEGLPPSHGGSTYGNEDRPWAITRGLVSGLAKSNPEATGAALEALGYVAGSDFLKRQGQSLAGMAMGPDSPYATTGKGLFDGDSVEDFLTSLGEQAGGAAASMAPMVPFAVGGAALGGLATGGNPLGIAAGGKAGAAVPSYLLNMGDLYNALKHEGVPEERAAKWAAGMAVPIAGLDALSFGETTGIGKPARDVAFKSLARYIAKEGGIGALTEGGTEALQQVIQAGTVAGVTGEDFLTKQNLKDVAASGVVGALVGAPTRVASAASDGVPITDETGRLDPGQQQALDEQVRATSTGRGQVTQDQLDQLRDLGTRTTMTPDRVSQLVLVAEKSPEEYARITRMFEARVKPGAEVAAEAPAPVEEAPAAAAAPANEPLAPPPLSGGDFERVGANAERPDNVTPPADPVVAPPAAPSAPVTVASVRRAISQAADEDAIDAALESYAEAATNGAASAEALRPLMDLANDRRRELKAAPPAAPLPGAGTPTDQRTEVGQPPPASAATPPRDTLPNLPRFDQTHLVAKLKTAFKLDDQQAEDTAATARAFAAGWAKRTGRPAEEWYGKYLAGVLSARVKITGSEGQAQTDTQDQAAQEALPQGSSLFLEDGRALISGFQTANVSTALHEFAHVYTMTAKREGWQDDIGAMESFAGVQNGQWTADHWEKVARAAERYFRDGQAPNPALKGAFERFRGWLTEIYRTLKGSPINERITPELRGMFDRWFAGGEPPISTAPATGGQPGASRAPRGPRTPGRLKVSTASLNQVMRGIGLHPSEVERVYGRMGESDSPRVKQALGKIGKSTNSLEEALAENWNTEAGEVFRAAGVKAPDDADGLAAALADPAVLFRQVPTDPQAAAQLAVEERQQEDTEEALAELDSRLEAEVPGEVLPVARLLAEASARKNGMHPVEVYERRRGGMEDEDGGGEVVQAPEAVAPPAADPLAATEAMADEEGMAAGEEGQRGEEFTLFQSADVAGAAPDEVAQAKREWQKKGTASRWFRRWFGGSRVVDGDGEPLVLYHGTTEDFDQFREGIIYLSPDPDYAAAYTHKSMSAVSKPSEFYTNNPKPNMLKVWASIKKPFDTRKPKERRIFEQEFYRQYGNGTPLDPERGVPDWTDAEALKEFFDEKGYDYDGLILAESHGRTTYAAFSSEQIKSATGNRGTFDPNSPNILYQRGRKGEPGQESQQLSLFGSVEEVGATNFNDKKAARQEWQEKGTDSRWFKRWFKRGAAVDDEGKAVLLYHGTTERGLTQLSPESAIETEGAVFLTDNSEVADTFTVPREYGEPVYYDENGDDIEPGEVMEVYTNIQNPLILEGYDAQKFIDDTSYQGKIIRQATQAGYDGVIAKDVKEGIGDRYTGNVYAVFSGKDIKSANNKGTFDATERILYQRPDQSRQSTRSLVDDARAIQAALAGTDPQAARAALWDAYLNDREAAGEDMDQYPDATWAERYWRGEKVPADLQQEVDSFRTWAGLIVDGARELGPVAPEVDSALEVMLGRQRPPKGPVSDREDEPPEVKERSFPQTLREAGLPEGTDLEYEVVTDKAAQASARNRVKKGVDAAEKYVLEGGALDESAKERMATGLEVLATRQAQARELLRQAAALRQEDPAQAEKLELQAGKAWGRANQLAAEMSARMTAGGQLVQSAKLAKKMDPAGVLYTAFEVVDKWNKEHPLAVEKGKGLSLSMAEANRLTGLAKEAEGWEALTLEVGTLADVAKRMAQGGQPTAQEALEFREALGTVRNVLRGIAPDPRAKVGKDLKLKDTPPAPPRAPAGNRGRRQAASPARTATPPAGVAAAPVDPKGASSRPALAEVAAKAPAPFRPKWAATTDAFLDSLEAGARKRMAERGIQIGAGIDPSLMADYVIIGATKVARGAVKFGEWSQAMGADLFGNEGINATDEEMRQLYAMSRKRYGELNNKARSAYFKLEKIEDGMARLEADPRLAGIPDLRVLRDAVVELQGMTGENAQVVGQEVMGAIEALKPATFRDKLRATVHIARLLNPKTLTRNIIGNELFWRTERLQHLLGATIDMTYAKGAKKDREITFNVAPPLQGDYWRDWWKGARLAWKGVQPGGLATSMDLPGAIAFRGKGLVQRGVEGAFKKKFDRELNVMGFLERTLGVGLRGFDYAAFERGRKTFLAEKAEQAATKAGITTDRAAWKKEWIATAEDNLLEQAREYGKYVTFQDDNALSDAAVGLQAAMRGNTKTKNRNLPFDLFILPYAKTPANLLARALEYSPAGFAKSAFLAAEPWWTGKDASRREVTLALSRAITGTTGLTAFGMYLLAQGVLTGSPEDDWETRRFLAEQTGVRGYQANLSALKRWALSKFDAKALKLRQGDTLYSYDWAQPLALSVSMGANIQQQLQKKGLAGVSAGEAVEVAGASFAEGIDTLFEQPLLQGLFTLFGGYGKDKVGNLERIAEDIPAGMVPAVFNQVRQSLDNRTRETHAETFLPTGANNFGRALNKAIARVPIISQSLPLAYKTLGKDMPREMYQDGSNGLFNVFLNPGFVSEYKVSPLVQMLLTPYEKAGENKQMPRAVSKKMTVSAARIKEIFGASAKDVEAGVSFALTGKEYAEFQRLAALYTTRNMAAVDRAELKRLTPEKQAARLNKEVLAAVEKAQETLIRQQGGLRYLREKLKGAKTKK